MVRARSSMPPALAIRMQRPIDPLQTLGPANPATQQSQQGRLCTLANKLARICYAVLRDHEPFWRCAVEPQIAAARPLPCLLDRIEPTSTLAHGTHRPSWLTGSRPHRCMPITSSGNSVAVRSDWHRGVADFHLGTGHTGPTSRCRIYDCKRTPAPPKDRSVSTCGGSPCRKR